MATNQSMQLDLGHWLLRLIAWIIDSIILGIIAFILVLFLFVPFVFVGAFADFYAAWAYVLVVPLALGILSVLYFLVLETSWGGTVGKRILGLRVQTVNGGKVSFGQSFIRNISKIFWIIFIIDFLIPLYN